MDVDGNLILAARKQPRWSRKKRVVLACLAIGMSTLGWCLARAVQNARNAALSAATT
jgi:hypothetical protein